MALRPFLTSLSARPARPAKILWGECLNEGVSQEAVTEAEEKLKLVFPAALRELFQFADGQQKGTPELLVAPKNKSVRFLSLRESRDLARYWREKAENPNEEKYWNRAGYNPNYVPIGFSSRFSVAVCVSAKVGRVVRFTTPDTKTSHSAAASQHLADDLGAYLRDLDDYFAGARQPFMLGS